MRVRLFALLAVLSLAAVPSPARSAEAKKAAEPAAVGQFQSIDEIMADIMYLAALAGHEEDAKNFDGIIKSQIGEKGLQGIDTKKPWGVYNMVVGTPGTVLVPITDEKAFLDLLGNLNQKPEKGDDGIYSLTPDGSPVTVYFRFANKYLYATAQDKDILAKEKLLDPSKVLLASRTSTVALLLHLDQVPNELKDMGLSQFEVALANAKDEKPVGETDAQHQFKVQFLDDLFERVKRFAKEGGDLDVKFNIDRKAHALTAEATVTAKSGSKLETNIADLGKATSLFGGMLNAGSAMNMLAHGSMPANLHKSFEPVVDEVVNKALENEKDKIKRQQAEKVLKALKPTFKSGEVDAGFSLRGPDADHFYTVLMGIKLTDGKGVENALRDLVRTLPERDQAKVKFNAEREGKVRIHRVDAQDAYDTKTRQVIGNNPIYVVIRDDAALITAGPGALKAVKELAVAEPKVQPQFEFEMGLARLAPLMAKEHPEAAKAAEEAFAKAGKGSDKIRFSVQGGEALKVRFAVQAPVVKFFSHIAESTRSRAIEQEREAAEKAAKEVKDKDK
ncbi:MAG TPA: hypothetical protein VG013_35480 [Gemmataceae bacterium]|jgi:hypothetical protein|nr:hypothetical protein [Gemmataceae bacterium]